MSALRIAALVPTYDNPATIRGVVEELRRYVADVLVVDDGSASPGREACQLIGKEGLALVIHHPENRGKGAAVKSGLVELQRLGFTHAVQIDADRQHAIGDMPRFLAAADAHPEALVLGQPEFDASAPRARLLARQLTCFWTRVETLGPVIVDPMCGYRVYPIARALAANARGDHMDFDPEIAVSIAWHGAPIVNLPTRVRYLRPEQGGVSHFRLWRDNARITWMHTRMVLALPKRMAGGARPKRIEA
jgi:polyprenyl-phospho-N-acetylgalactosaminyl synthase